MKYKMVHIQGDPYTVTTTVALHYDKVFSLRKVVGYKSYLLFHSQLWNSKLQKKK